MGGWQKMLDRLQILFSQTSMYGIFTYMYHENKPNVGKYTQKIKKHGWYGHSFVHVPE